MIPINAFLMAMAAALFIHFASTMRGVTVETIVLLGIALVFTFNALLSLLEYLASEQALAAVVFWTHGQPHQSDLAEGVYYRLSTSIRSSSVCTAGLGADRVTAG
jgi:ABC-type Fe3+-siderophore transport system permease subunit